MKNLVLTLLLLSGAAAAQTTPPAATPTTTPAPAPATPATTTPAPTTPATPTPATTAPATAAPAPAPAQDSAALVAQIGSEKVTLGEFDSAFRAAVARVVNQQGMPFEDSLMAEFASARPDYLKQYVRDRAVYQLARASIKPDVAVIDDQIAKARANFKTDEEFSQALGSIGYTSLDAFRASLEQQNVVGTYLQGIQKKFTFSDTLVGTFYNLHKSSFMTDAQACVKHILVPTKAEADAIAGELAAGGDFAKIAAAKSKDPGSAAQGGDLGCLEQGETVASFDKASFSGPLNQVQVIQSEYGWHILVVTRRTPAGLRPLEEVAPAIRAQLTRDAAQKYLDAQIARLNIKTYPEVVTVAPAAAPATAPAAAPATAPAATPAAPKK